MTTEKLNRAKELDEKREYYASKLNEVAKMRQLAEGICDENSYGEPIINVSIGTGPYSRAFLIKSHVMAMLLEAEKFYMAKKLAVVDEFAKL